MGIEIAKLFGCGNTGILNTSSAFVFAAKSTFLAPHDNTPYSCNIGTAVGGHRRSYACCGLEIRKRASGIVVCADNTGHDKLQDQERHSEQRNGFQPPPPLEDDGYIVDLDSIQDLFDSGDLPAWCMTVSTVQCAGVLQPTGYSCTTVVTYE